jgi:hypothetical protein
MRARFARWLLALACRVDRNVLTRCPRSGSLDRDDLSCLAQWHDGDVVRALSEPRFGVGGGHPDDTP